MIEVKEHRLDETDKEILKHLQQDARISNVAFSQAIHLSPSPCLERVKRLERLGYIEGYQAKLNPDLLGVRKATFSQVNLDSTSEDIFYDF